MQGNRAPGAWARRVSILSRRQTGQADGLATARAHPLSDRDFQLAESTRRSVAFQRVNLADASRRPAVTSTDDKPSPGRVSIGYADASSTPHRAEHQRRIADVALEKKRSEGAFLRDESVVRPHVRRSAPRA